MKAVLAWAIDPSGGNAPSYLDQVNFVPLPSKVVAISAKLISKIAGSRSGRQRRVDSRVRVVAQSGRGRDAEGEGRGTDAAPLHV